MLSFKPIFFALILTFGLHAEDQVIPEIICPSEPMIDEEIFIEVKGLTPGRNFRIEGSFVDFENVKWVSEGLFKADRKGNVFIGKQAPIVGSYHGIDPMGLFWSMEMKNVVIPAHRPELDEEAPLDGCFFFNQIAVYDGDELLVKKNIYRKFIHEDVEFVRVRENGLIGNLYLPPLTEPVPLVVVLTGSNGGIQWSTAALFAYHGIPALALAYSGIGDLPPTVEDVPLEYFEKAFEWIENDSRFNGEIYLHGTSRGGELALLLGSLFPDKIHKIVARAPSSVVLSKDSWTYHDEPVLPAAPHLIDVNNDYLDQPRTRKTPLRVRTFRERGFLIEQERLEAASLPVENIECPIMLITGGDDQLGPASIYAERIINRLERYDSSIERIHLNYPEAGHLISMPYMPRINLACDDGTWILFGGTPFADEYASRDSWKKTLEFFRGEESFPIETSE